ncbi:unnamed protein product [Lactuca saligna]|uniref:Uncharacterized protein n=1 Tax=Lactuca saligna TaxID=75948 RepID=A0AA35Z7D8_LACSI|nr:unnamed protein product [Lactuca saligna]
MYPLPRKHRYTIEQAYMPTKQRLNVNFMNDLYRNRVVRIKILECKGVVYDVISCSRWGSEIMVNETRCMGVVCLRGDVRCDLGYVSPKVVACMAVHGCNKETKV